MSPARVAEALRMLADAIAAEERRPPEAPPLYGPAFVTRRQYAQRVSLSPRTLDALIARGLPVVGRARLLRIDVAAADPWLRAHLADEDEGDDVEQLARRNATGGIR